MKRPRRQSRHGLQSGIASDAFPVPPRESQEKAAAEAAALVRGEEEPGSRKMLRTFRERTAAEFGREEANPS
jgi:hypothetical protein